MVDDEERSGYREVNVAQEGGPPRRYGVQPLSERGAVEPEAARQAERARLARRRAVVERVENIVDYVFLLLYGLLAIRFLLLLAGASPDAGFVAFVRALTSPFYAPFSGIVANTAVDGREIDVPLLIALAAYGLLHLAVRGLLRVLTGRRLIG